MQQHAPINFQQLFESAPGLYLVLSPDLVIMTASNAYLNATLTQREAITGQYLFDVFPDNPDDPHTDGTAKLRDSLLQVLQTSAPHTMDIQKYDIRKPDGTFEARYWKPVNTPVTDAGGKITSIIHCVEDVTDFMHTQNEIREVQTHIQLSKKLLFEKQRFENILQSMGDAFVSLDHGWRYTFVNNNALALMGKTTADLLGNTLWEVFPDTVGTIFETEYRKVMHERVSSTFEVFYDSYNMWLLVKVYPYEGGIAVFYNDVTSLKQSEQEILTLNRGLEKKVLERTRELEISNHELESFTYSVSHDLRAPLRAIHGYARMLEEDYAGRLDDEGKRFVSVIQENANKMGLLIDDLLAFSRLGKKEIKKMQVDMQSLVQEVLHELLPVTGPHYSIHTAALPPVQGDAALLKQVFVNLLSNAIKYSSTREKPVINIVAYRENDALVYKISDNGVGFDMRYVHKLFGVFQRLHDYREFPGTGVGLAIVDRIVQKHGGRVKAEGETGKGATFYVILPEK